MKVLFDHQIFSDQVVGGVSRYFSMLLAHLTPQLVREARLGIRVSSNQYLRTVPNLGYLHIPGRSGFPGIRRAMKMTNSLYSRRLLAQGDFDIFHPTYYNPYFLEYVGSRPYILTVYDLIHDLFPEQYGGNQYFRTWMELTTRDAAAIIAISASTKRDLVRLYGVDEARISVVHLGATDFTPLRKSLRWVPPDRYVLFVGGRRGYKNFDVLVEALPPVFVRDRSLHLVCAGGGSFTREELNAFASSGLAGRIHQVNVDDETLGVLYARAVALIYPSRYEGFGMPVLEAFNCGCPVIAARVSSIPEIGGDAALYIDPQDPSSICASLDRLLDDPDQRVDLASRGRARVQEFTWERTARATAKVYRSVLNL